MLQRVFTDFSKRHMDLFGRHTVSLGHSFAGSPLFADAALAALLERAPPGSTQVSTIDMSAHAPLARREGVLDGLAGMQAIEAVRRGHIWISVRDPGRYDPAFQAMLALIYRELEQLVPGLRTSQHKLSLQISSPRAQTGYHAVVAGQMLWQVRGHRRVFVYPGTLPFLGPQALERIASGDADGAPLDYEPWFDEYATVIDLAPGRTMHWPANSPLRIVNADSLDVSFTTEHWTQEQRNAHAVNYANGVLRQRLGAHELARPVSGPGLWVRRGLAAAWRAAGMHQRRARKSSIDFRVDPEAPHCVRTITPFELSR